MDFLGKILKIISIIITVIYIIITFYLMIFRAMIDDGSENKIFISVLSFIIILVVLASSKEYSKYQIFLLIFLGIIIFMNCYIILYSDKNFTFYSISYAFIWLSILPISLPLLTMIIKRKR